MPLVMFVTISVLLWHPLLTSSFHIPLKVQYNYYCITLVRWVASNLAALYHSWLQSVARNPSGRCYSCPSAVLYSRLYYLVDLRPIYSFFVSVNQNYRCKHVKLQKIVWLRQASIRSHDIWRRSPTIRQLFTFLRISSL